MLVVLYSLAIASMTALERATDDNARPSRSLRQKYVDPSRPSWWNLPPSWSRQELFYPAMLCACSVVRSPRLSSLSHAAGSDSSPSRPSSVQVRQQIGVETKQQPATALHFIHVAGAHGTECCRCTYDQAKAIQLAAVRRPRQSVYLPTKPNFPHLPQPRRLRFIPPLFVRVAHLLSSSACISNIAAPLWAQSTIRLRSAPLNPALFKPTTTQHERVRVQVT